LPKVTKFTETGRFLLLALCFAQGWRSWLSLFRHFEAHNRSTYEKQFIPKMQNIQSHKQYNLCIMTDKAGTLYAKPDRLGSTI